MAKKTFGFEEPAQPSEKSAAGKLPIDSAGAGKALPDYQEIPVDWLHPFTQKGSWDYSKYDKLRQEQMIASIKQYGVLEPLIVRKSQTEMSKYEILAGERRWEASKAAGIKKVPCRIMDLDDKAARGVFHLTNLMGRDLMPSDKIYGWYNYYVEVKGASDPDKAVDAEISQVMAAEQEQVAAMVGGKSLTKRMILRYVKMHNLIRPWIERLDEGAVTGRAAYQLAFLPVDIQEKLLDYKVTEKKADWLHKVYDGAEDIEWHDDIIKENFEKLIPEADTKKEPVVSLTKEEKEQRKKTKELTKRFNKAMPDIKSTLRERLRPQDYENASTIIAEALDLYYETKGS